MHRPDFRGNIIRDDMISLAGVDTIPNSSFMLVAELVNGPTAGSGLNQVAMYDYMRVMQTQNPDIQPMQRFIGHGDVVTAIAAGDREFKDIFLSGERLGNCGVAVWSSSASCCLPRCF